MKKYYTRVCNFYYGPKSKHLIRKKKALPLNGNLNISFDHIEILSRNKNRLVHINQIKNLPLNQKKIINKNLKNITKKKNNFSKFNFNNSPNIMGVLNLTPDSFSDGGKYNKKISGYKRAINLFNSGSDIVDIGGESTRPGANPVNEKKEWSRISPVIKKLKKKNSIIFRY